MNLRERNALDVICQHCHQPLDADDTNGLCDECWLDLKDKWRDGTEADDE